MHSDTDEVTPYEKGRAVYDGAPAPKYFVTIVGANHDDPFTDGPEAPAAGRLMAEFLDGQLKADPTALAALDERRQPVAVPARVRDAMRRVSRATSLVSGLM